MGPTYLLEISSKVSKRLKILAPNCELQWCKTIDKKTQFESLNHDILDLYQNSTAMQTQLRKTRMHSSRMRTARYSGCLGGCLPGGCLSRERGCLPKECTPPGPKAAIPPVNRITDRCKNITFSQLLLRTVNSSFFLKSQKSHNLTISKSR